MPRSWLFASAALCGLIVPTVIGAVITPPVPTVAPASPAAATRPPGAKQASSADVHGPGRLSTLALPVREAGRQARQVVVYTPRVADPNALPILYLLHGLPGSAADLCSPAAAGVLDNAFRAGAAPFMVVCPDGNSAAVGDSEWADDVSGRAALETFVTGEVREAVEGDHPRLPAMRALGGFSMGGFAAASIGLRHPELFGQVVALAGYFQIDDPDRVFGTDPVGRRAHDPGDLVSAARGQRWFLDEASHDTLPLTAHAAEGFAPKLRAAHATVTIAQSPGEHSAAWAVGQLGAVARFLSGGWGIP